MIARALLWTIGLATIGSVIGFAYFRFGTPTFEARGLVLVQPANSELRRQAESVLKSPAVFHQAISGLSQYVKTSKGQRMLSQEATLSESAQIAPTSENVLEIRLASPSRDMAKLVIDAWISAYNASASATNLQIDGAKLKQKEKEVLDAKTKLDAIDRKVAEFKQRTGIPDISQAVTTAANYESTLIQQRDQYLTELETIKRQTDQERRQLPLIPSTTVSSTTQTVNPILKSKQDQLASLESQKVELLATWLPTSTPVQNVDLKIKAVEAEIAKFKQTLQVDRSETAPNPQRRLLEDNYFNNQAQIEGLKGSIEKVGLALAKLKTASKGLPAAQLEMGKLAREQTLAEGVYKDVRLEYEARLNGTALPTLPVLSRMGPAEASAVPIFPKLVPCLTVGSSLGAFFGLLVALVLRTRASNDEILQDRVPAGPELPVLVIAPPLPARRKDGLEILALSGGNPAEAYRFMVFSLQARDNPAKTILFTAVSNDPLCAEAASQFAVAMAQTGVRTLLIDCNLRDPSLTKAFGFLGKSGITDILSRTMLPSAGNDLVLETSHPDLYFLPAGTLESEGIGGFQNLQVQGMLQDVMDRAEIKIVNTPACAIVSDASRLARHVDQICLIANRQDQSKGLVAKAESILRLAGAREIEIVLVDEKRARDSFVA